MIYVNSKDNKIKIYTGLLITVICIIGISYAWFRLYLRQSENNKIASRNCFSTTLTEDSAKIDLVDAVAMYDEEGLEETPFTFTIKNNCSGYVKAYITIDSQYRETSSNSYLQDDFVKVNISPKGNTNGASVVLTSQNLIDLDNSRKGYLIVDAGLNSNEERSFDLRIWMDSETTAAQGVNKTWLGKIVVVTQASNIASPDGWNSAANKTLLSAIKRDNDVSETQTTPGSQPSLATEAVLASAEDDYGTSYYFRGAVENNYVEYANMCWRIVRVLGDGTVRLTLYNYNGLTSSNTTTPSSSTPCNVTSSTGAYARYSDSNYTSAFNTTYSGNAYIGFMYGNVSGSTYALTHANTNKSTILTNLESWYTNVLSKTDGFAESQLADAIWCNDKTLLTGTIGGVTYSGNGVGTNESAYGASRRLMGNTLAAGGTGPSFKCSTDNSNLSRFTVSNTDGNAKLSKPIGLLTADEIAYAGSVYGNNSSEISDLSDRNIYLTKNAGSGYRSMTPYDFNGVNAIVYNVNADGILQTDAVWKADYGLRPSIVLVNTVLINGGDGTATNPYKVKM